MENLKHAQEIYEVSHRFSGYPDFSAVYVESEEAFWETVVYAIDTTSKQGKFGCYVTNIDPKVVDTCEASEVLASYGYSLTAFEETDNIHEWILVEWN